MNHTHHTQNYGNINKMKSTTRVVIMYTTHDVDDYFLCISVHRNYKRKKQRFWYKIGFFSRKKVLQISEIRFFHYYCVLFFHFSFFSSFFPSLFDFWMTEYVVDLSRFRILGILDLCASHLIISFALISRHETNLRCNAGNLVTGTLHFEGQQKWYLI